MSYGYHHGFRGYDYENYGRNSILDRNHDHLITEADFAMGAREMGFGTIGSELARSAFRTFDRNRDGLLSREDAFGAYGSIHRLYN